MARPETIKIPPTIAEAVESLQGLGSLITAKKWERAAIVAAFVRLGDGQGTSSKTGRGSESAREFSTRGIVGLSGTSSVTKYVQAWLDSHDGEYPVPGQKVVIPITDFPPTRTGTDGYDTDSGAQDTVERIIRKHGTAPVVRAIASRPAPEQADALEDLAVTVKQGMNLPFDTPPPFDPLRGAKLRPGVVVTSAVHALNSAAFQLTQALGEYEMGSDPVADGALANALDTMEELERAIRAKLGLDNWEHV